MNQLDLFTGEVNENVAHVYARLPRTHANQKITGRIRGPFNQFAQTLPANATFRDLGPGDTVLARAVVTDPCTWSPNSPALYQVTIETTDESGNTVVYEHKHFGIRRFEARGKDLYLDGKRWVARGISVANGTELIDQLAEYHEHAAVQVLDYDAVKVPHDNYLPNFYYDVVEAITKASECGVPVIIKATSCATIHLETIREYASYPCVFIVAVGSPDNAELIKNQLPNVLMAQYVYPSVLPAAWADIAWLPILKNVKSKTNVDWKIPVIAYGLDGFDTFKTGRLACDKLQADLAPLGQFAGYVV